MGLRRLRALVAALAAARGAGAVSGAGKATAPGPCGRAGPGPAACGAGGGRADAALQAWGLWADSVRERAEQRLAVTTWTISACSADPEYGQALDAGGVLRRGAARGLEAALARWRAGFAGCATSRFTPSLIAPRLREE